MYRWWHVSCRQAADLGPKVLQNAQCCGGTQRCLACKLCMTHFASERCVLCCTKVMLLRLYTTCAHACNEDIPQPSYLWHHLHVLHTCKLLECLHSTSCQVKGRTPDTCACIYTQACLSPVVQRHPYRGPCRPSEDRHLAWAAVLQCGAGCSQASTARLYTCGKRKTLGIQLLQAP